MDLSAVLTSAGINIAICMVLLSLYSILRKQSSFVNVYFGQRLAQVKSERSDNFCFDRFIPSASWLVKALETSEEEICAVGGLDAVVFIRIVVFSVRIFSIAATVCIFLLLPLNYFGKAIENKEANSVSLDLFTISSIQVGSKWLLAHCLALYIITCCACVLLYLDYKSLTSMRLEHVAGSFPDVSLFTVLVRGIPWSPQEACSDCLEKFFRTYYASSYLSYQMIYRCGTVQKLVNDAQKMCSMLISAPTIQYNGANFIRCGFCGGTANSFKLLTNKQESVIKETIELDGLDLNEKESSAALVFFRTRYTALVASLALQTPNTMLWVTDLAPEPQDMYWTSVIVPYKLLWIRKMATFLASLCLTAFYLLPVGFVQSLVRLENLEKKLPFLKPIARSNGVVQLVTGYLPSVILMIFMYIVPPIMMLFSTAEGSISRSRRKMSASVKVLCFYIWNVFFANVLSGGVVDRLIFISEGKSFTQAVAKQVPTMATFFMTYVMTSGWACLASELIQPFGLLYVLFYKIFRKDNDGSCYEPYTFPYQTELPRVLLFVLLGFTSSVLAPLMLPLLLVFFILAYPVYRNQVLNVYITRYNTGGLYWPLAHNAIIFSLIVMQALAMSVFTLKESTLATSFTVPLIICTIIFNEYCRLRFYPVFKNNPAQVLMEMDQQDECQGRLEEIHQKLLTAYSQIQSTHDASCASNPQDHDKNDKNDKIRDRENKTPGSWNLTIQEKNAR